MRASVKLNETAITAGTAMKTTECSRAGARRIHPARALARSTPEPVRATGSAPRHVGQLVEHGLRLLLAQDRRVERRAELGAEVQERGAPYSTTPLSRCSQAKLPAGLDCTNSDCPDERLIGTPTSSLEISSWMLGCRIAWTKARAASG